MWWVQVDDALVIFCVILEVVFATDHGPGGVCLRSTTLTLVAQAQVQTGGTRLVAHPVVPQAMYEYVCLVAQYSSRVHHTCG